MRDFWGHDLFPSKVKFKLLATPDRDTRFTLACPVCNRTISGYGRRSILKRHINEVHLKIKSYQCPICEKKYTQSGSRDRHVRRVHAQS